MFCNDDEITICSSHRQYPTQLIWTFAFPYAEYWCPACGKHEGMLGAGVAVKWNYRIHHRYLKYLKSSRKFLRAKGRLNCAYFKYHSRKIKPEEMPVKLRKYYEKQATKWKYKFS
jgi:hypothetical protein